jgi:signal peptidase I
MNDQPLIVDHDSENEDEDDIYEIEILLPSQHKLLFRYVIEIFLIAFMLAMITRAFIVQAFRIPSGSMRMTLQEGDMILANKFTHHFSKPERGDILVFKHKTEDNRTGDQEYWVDYIKRTIGLPEEEVEMVNEFISINGEELNEQYKHLDDYSYRCFDFQVQVPPDRFFMMGDNRRNSSDSRVWGTLEKSLIKGKAVVIYWPPGRMGTL